MDHLYNRLDGAYPGRWRKDFPDPQSVENWRESWVEAFEEEGITQAEVAVALRKVAPKEHQRPPRKGCSLRPSTAVPVDVRGRVEFFMTRRSGALLALPVPQFLEKYPVSFDAVADGEV